jgi:hypothetical protein
MSEDEIEKLTKSCEAVLKPGENRAWNLELTEDTPECRCALRAINENLGPASKKFLKERIVVHNSELKKILDEQ